MNNDGIGGTALIDIDRPLKKEKQWKASKRVYPRLILTAMVAAVITPIFTALMILIDRLWGHGSPFNYNMVRLWSWIISKSMGVSYACHGLEKIDPNTSYIIAPNHQGNMDIAGLLICLPVPCRWVLKKSMLRIPFIGRALRATGVIAIDRSDPRLAAEQLRQGMELVTSGWSAVIYPEGTRTVDGSVGPFKRGAFVMAVESGFPILPVSVNGAFQCLPRNSLALRPGRVEFIVGDPIPTEGLTESDIPALMDKTRDAIMAHLNPEYDPFGKRA
jgi:1-acyl-sn-glycerol-3-phosphate acyltransferase